MDEKGLISWATIFHGRLAITRKPMTFEQFGVLNNAVSLYTRENPSGVQKRRHFQIFERYLSMHKVDPENSSVGVYVSDEFRDLPVGAGSNAGVTMGAMVLARIDRGGEPIRVGLGDSVLCRVMRNPAKPDDDDCPVLVSFDPQERYAQEVPLGVLTVLTHAHEAALVTVQSGDFGALADPAENIYRYFRDEVLAENLVAVAVGGLADVLPPEKAEALLRGQWNGVWDIRSLEYVAKFFRMEITDKEVLENYANGLDSKWDEYRAGVLDAVTAHKVSFHILVCSTNIEALRSLTLCGLIRRAVAEKAAEVEKVVAELKTTRDEILAGGSKQTMMNEYLAAVKKGLRGFLSARGYDFDVIPQNYIDAPPTDKERVVTNLGVCREAAVAPELQQIIKIVCDAAYFKIDAWISGATAILAKKLEVKDVGPDDVPGAIAAVRPKVEAMVREKPDSKTAKRYVSLLEDIDYFVAMKKADDAISSGAVKPGEAAEYVMSIHAAAKSRLKLIEEECVTVIDIWGTPEQKKRAVDVGTDREIKRIPLEELKVVKNVQPSPDTIIDMTLPPNAQRVLSKKAPGL